MWQTITDNLKIDVRERWLGILSDIDNQFISISSEEIEPLIAALRMAHIILTCGTHNLVPTEDESIKAATICGVLCSFCIDETHEKPCHCSACGRLIAL